jgi:hypothetical protein
MAKLPHITHFGLPGIDRVPFGMHARHFFSTRRELAAALVPYFAAGLRANERCLWVTASPLPAREAIRALGAAWDGVDDAVHTGALRILESEQFTGLDLMPFWLEEEKRTLAEGYHGLRIAANMSGLTPDDWATSMEYEQTASAALSGRRIVMLCSYVLMQCNDWQTSEAMRAHHCALERPDAHWQVVAVPRFRKARERIASLLNRKGISKHADPDETYRGAATRPEPVAPYQRRQQ